MSTLLQLVGYEFPSFDGFAVALAWSWEEWAWGYCSEFAELGFSALVLGPLHVQFEWKVIC